MQRVNNDKYLSYTFVEVVCSVFCASSEFSHMTRFGVTREASVAGHSRPEQIEPNQALG